MSLCRLKDLKLTKARVDTHWKKQPLGVSNTNATNVPVAAGVKATGPLLRSNSIRNNVAAVAPSVVGRPAANANSKRK